MSKAKVYYRKDRGIFFVQLCWKGKAWRRFQKSTLYQDTRHSFATQHLDQLDLVGRVLGHTRTDMTRRYQGLNLER